MNLAIVWSWGASVAFVLFAADIRRTLHPVSISCVPAGLDAALEGDAFLLLSSGGEGGGARAVCYRETHMIHATLAKRQQDNINTESWRWFLDPAPEQTLTLKSLRVNVRSAVDRRARQVAPVLLLLLLSVGLTWQLHRASLHRCSHAATYSSLKQTNIRGK